MNKSIYLAATLAVSCVGAGWWLAQTQHRLGSLTEADELRALRGELAELQQKMQSVDRRAGSSRWLERMARSAADEEPVHSVDDDPPTATTSPEEPKEQGATEQPSEAEQQANYLALVDQVFGSEPRDATWGAQRELDVQLRGKLPPESRVEALDCRTTLCRLVTSHRDEQSYQAFIAGAFLPQAADGARAWSGSAIFDATDSSAAEDFRTTTYLVRENHALPTAGVTADDGAR